MNKPLDQKPSIYDYMYNYNDAVIYGQDIAEQLAKQNGPSPLPSDYGVQLMYSGSEVSFRELIRNTFDTSTHYSHGDGWKIHLTIDPRDLRRAWDEVIAPILLDTKVGAAKFADGVALEAFSDPQNPQAGKMVTIYGAGDKTWAEIAKRMEIGLAQAGIRPGPPVIRGDRMVPGSCYIGYRNERFFPPLGQSGYLAADKIRRFVAEGRVEAGWEYNPTKQPDTLKNIDFSSDPDVQAARNGDVTLRKNQILPQKSDDQVSSWVSMYAFERLSPHQVIGDAPWFNVVDRNGAKAKYASLKGISVRQKEILAQSLRDQGVKYEIKQSKLHGGIEVIAVQTSDFDDYQRNLIMKEVQWKSVTDRDGVKQKYLDMKDAPAGLMRAFRDQGIPYKIKDSTFHGGMQVIAVRDSDFEEFRKRDQIIFGKPLGKSPSPRF